MRSVLAALLLCLSAVAVRAQTIIVPFHDVNGRMMIDSKVNGKPARLLVDTGAQHSFDLRSYRPMTTIVRGNSLEFLDESPGMHVIMIKPAEKFDGVIGISTLEQFHAVRIDYRRHVIELGE